MDRETHEQTLDRVEAMLREFPYSTQRDSQSSTSTITVNGGGWFNTLTAIFMGGLALAMFILYLSDRNAAAREVESVKAQARAEVQEFKQQSRVDVQRLDGTLNRQAEKLETHDAYINDMFRRMKDK